MIFAFLFGFISALAAVIGAVAWAGVKTRPLLQQHLAAQTHERKTTRAKAVRASASVDKFKVTSIEAVHIAAVPAHISTAGVPCRLAMIGGAITISTAHALKKKHTAPNPATCPEDKLPSSHSTDRAIATLSGKNIICRADPTERNVLHIYPRVEGAHIAEVTDTIQGETRQVRWRSLKLTFEGGARETDRWLTVLNPNPATERWLKFVKTVPSGAATSINFFVARILFENSAQNTLDDFIANKVRSKLAKVSLPSPLHGTLALVDLHFGDEAPFFTNPNFTGVSGTGEFGFDFDLLYRGGFQIALALTLQIGPIKVPNLLIDVTISRIEGKVHMSIGSPPSNKMWIAFHEDPRLELVFKQELQLPPEVKFLASAIRGIDLSATVSEVVRTKLFEDMILPNMDDLPIPDIGPTPPGTPNEDGTYLEPAHAPKLTDWSLAEKSDDPAVQELARKEKAKLARKEQQEAGEVPTDVSIESEGGRRSGQTPAQSPAAKSPNEVDAQLQRHLSAGGSTTTADSSSAAGNSSMGSRRRSNSGSQTPPPAVSNAGVQTPHAMSPVSEAPSGVNDGGPGRHVAPRQTFRDEAVAAKTERDLDQDAANVRRAANEIRERIQNIVHRRSPGASPTPSNPSSRPVTPAKHSSGRQSPAAASGHSMDDWVVHDAVAPPSGPPSKKPPPPQPPAGGGRQGSTSSLVSNLRTPSGDHPAAASLTSQNGGSTSGTTPPALANTQRSSSSSPPPPPTTKPPNASSSDEYQRPRYNPQAQPQW